MQLTELNEEGLHRNRRIVLNLCSPVMQSCWSAKAPTEVFANACTGRGGSELTGDGPPVTWLMPVKNGMPYLPHTLRSIEAQTYKNWRVLASDNGSTDGTLEELQRWIPSRLPGRIIADEPLSLGKSLARLVGKAETELCARSDVDDAN